MKNSKSAIKKCAQSLKILSDETRLRILREIKDGEKTVSEINNHLKIDQSLLSHHLKILKEAKLVTCVRQGKFFLYKSGNPVIKNKNSEFIDLGCCTLNFN